MTSYFIELDQSLSHVGGKARGLVEMKRQKLPVPPFVILSPDVDIHLDWNEFKQALHKISDSWPGTTFAVRSSAHDEDSSEHSFAGLFETVLGVELDDIESAIQTVWDSANSERVQAYRKEQGIDQAAQKPAVVIQALVPADFSGVAFSCNPVDLTDPSVLISAVRGLGTSLVDGQESSSDFWVSADGKITRELHDQGSAFTVRDGQVHKVKLPEDQTTTDLNDEALLNIAQLARSLEANQNAPQDIEWAMADGQLWLLQTRPVTTVQQPTGKRYRLWDNSNIAESYSGVTTPLTFSFARHVYEGVYEQFLSILGVTRTKIRTEKKSLQTMLGLHHGQIYYNMNSWYRILALLPGFKFNQRFMEQMMGVKESLPDELAHSLQQSSRWERMKDAAQLGTTVIKLIVLNNRLPAIQKRFLRRFNQVLDASKQIDDTDLEACIEAYQTLETELIPSWDAPLINDFFAMIYVGVLAKLCENWLEEPHLHAALLSASGDIISAEPVQRITRMAKLIQDRPEWIERFQQADADIIHAALPEHPQLQAELNAYLDKFSDRCLGELKLESLSLNDDASTLYLAIAAQAQHPLSRTETEQIDIESKLVSLKPMQQKLFRWILKQARARVRDRENLRFERTRLFGQVRHLMLAVGQQLENQKTINETRDIFYLELNELISLVEGTATIQNIKALVEIRKQEFEAFKSKATPDRFDTRGPVAWVAKQSREPIPENADYFSGTGACAGIVEGTVRVVTDPSNVNMQQGEILVAQQTDPGWVMLFPLASGLLVERGSLLSHSAIVARELGLPAVVSIPNLLSQLTSGDRVRFDGQTGEVWKILDSDPSETTDVGGDQLTESDPS